MKVTSSAFTNSASSTATILLFTSDSQYLPAQKFVSLVTKTDQYQVYKWFLYGRRNWWAEFQRHLPL